MDAKALKKLIASGESAHVEFKESFGDAVIESLVAMSNAGGGRIIIGVRDNGTVCGITPNKPNIASWINDIKMKTSPALFPDIELAGLHHDIIAVITIKDVPIKPVATKGKCFIRRGSSNHLMSIPEIADMYLKTYNLSWDSLIDPDTTPADLSPKKVERFRELLEKQASVTVPEDSFTLLKKFSLLKNDRETTFAASLLFSAKPPINTAIHAVRFKGTTKDESTEDIYIQEDLVAETELLMEFIHRSIRKGVRKVSALKQLTHETVWQYPPDAMRELVVNLVIHRDYKNASPSCLFIFDDRIEMWNPGEMPKGLSLAKLQSGDYEPSARNPLLTRVFKELGLIENLGSGLQKVCRILTDAGLPLPFMEALSSGTRIVVRSENPEKYPVKHSEDSVKSSVKSSVKILSLLAGMPSISAAEVSCKIGLTLRAVEKIIAKLKATGKIKRIGPDKGGHWEVVE